MRAPDGDHPGQIQPWKPDTVVAARRRYRVFRAASVSLHGVARRIVVERRRDGHGRLSRTPAELHSIASAAKADHGSDRRSLTPTTRALLEIKENVR
jgi:hypothetical protein